MLSEFCVLSSSMKLGPGCIRALGGACFLKVLSAAGRRTSHRALRGVDFCFCLFGLPSCKNRKKKVWKKVSMALVNSQLLRLCSLL